MDRPDRKSIVRVARQVTSILESREQRLDQRMIDGGRHRFRLQVALGDVCGVRFAVDQDPVPGPVLGRPAGRHGVIPFLGFLEIRVDIEDDAAIAVFQVLDELADVKFCLVIGHRDQPRILCCCAAGPDAAPLRSPAGAPILT